jgi:NOL1/NOP2/fmu family ribosome biogenesis protein
MFLGNDSDELQNPAESRTEDTLAEFVRYCKGKDLPFWEALRLWCGVREVLLSNGSGTLQNPRVRNFRPKEWRAR